MNKKLFTAKSFGKSFVFVVPSWCWKKSVYRRAKQASPPFAGHFWKFDPKISNLFFQSISANHKINAITYDCVQRWWDKCLQWTRLKMNFDLTFFFLLTNNSKILKSHFNLINEKSASHAFVDKKYNCERFEWFKFKQIHIYICIGFQGWPNIY